MSNNDFINNGILEYDIGNWENRDELEYEETETFEQISDKNFKSAIKASQEVIKTFAKEVFGEKQLKKVEKIFKDVNCELDKDLSAPDISGYFDGENIFIANEFASRNKETYHLIHTIIHEYAHAFSKLIIKNEQIYFGLNDVDSMINPILEEAFANLFAEMSINNYYKKDRTLSYLTEEKNQILSLNYLGNDLSYYDEGNFLKTILFFLKKENKDLSAIENYFFESKGDFADECISVLGEEIWEIFKRLRNVRNGLWEENNTKQHLPKEILNLINHIEKNMSFDEKEYEKRDENALYNTQNCILDYISFLRNNKLDELSVDGIDFIVEKSKGKVQEICTNYGYSDNLKEFILKCLKESNCNPYTISKIIEIAGGVPFDVIKAICENKDINYVVDMYIKCNVLSWGCNYKDAISFLQDKVANDFGKKTNNTKEHKDKIDDWTRISNLTLEYLLKKDASNEQIKVILNFYIGNTKLHDINSVLNTVEELGDEGLDEEAKNGLGKLAFDIGHELELLDEVNDLQLLKDIFSKNVINDTTLGYYFEHNTVAIQKLENEVSEAIECFKRYGYNIENKDEIIEDIKQCNFKALEVKPNIDVGLLKEFKEEDISKIRVLLNMSIEQFLEKHDLDLTKGSKDYNDILLLIDFYTHEKFNMENYSREKILNKIKSNVIQAKNVEEIDDIDESFFETSDARNNDVLQSGVIATEKIQIGPIRDVSKQLIEDIKELDNKEKDSIENNIY